MRAQNLPSVTASGSVLKTQRYLYMALCLFGCCGTEKAQQFTQLTEQGAAEKGTQATESPAPLCLRLSGTTSPTACRLACRRPSALHSEFMQKERKEGRKGARGRKKRELDWSNYNSKYKVTIYNYNYSFQAQLQLMQNKIRYNLITITNIDY
ncbi:hypothetical protein E2C01_042479 [Portunus trituberculatus]|uniref:Uncharacterized protein n=1 Tax=Portunus trituberculatus TaxID=210409 RepID=A0A5B7FUX2_PORTR|nr:hypothetical protein [Portunus trituberculatus]